MDFISVFAGIFYVIQILALLTDMSRPTFKRSKRHSADDLCEMNSKKKERIPTVGGPFMG